MSRAPILTFIALLLLATPAGARCIVVPPPPPHHPHPVLPPEIRVSEIDVRLEIVDGVATARWRESIVNPGSRELQARFVMPLPRGAVVRGASLKIGDTWVESEVLEAGQARRAYEDIVRRAIDPALVEYLDEGMVRTRVFPVPPGATREIELNLTLALPEEFGRWSLRLPTRLASDPGTRVRVQGDVRSSRALATPYSPTHDLHTRALGETAWEFEVARGLRENDLQLLLPIADREVTATLASHGSRSGEGTLLLRLSPGFDSGVTERLPRDLVVVLDTSGSMGGEKIRQARAALRTCVESLGPDDRFALITYEADVRVRTDGLARATQDVRNEVLRAVDSIEAQGGTNIARALDEALHLLGPSRSRPAYVVLLTDGLPTVGEKVTERIRELARDANRRDARVFTFGVGTDVDARLLDALATDHGATSRYVLPGEDLEIALGDFALQIAEPVWSGLRLRWRGVEVSRPTPVQLPDLFRGQTLTLLARYRGSGRVTLTVEGRRGDRRLEKRFEFELRDHPGEHGYLPALWAGRRVAWLERELRVNPGDGELRDEIRRLGEEFGLVTSQTSLLVREEEPRLTHLGVQPPRSMPRPRGDNAKRVQMAAGQSRALDATSSFAMEESENTMADASAPGSEADRGRRVDSRRLAVDAANRWTEHGLENAEPDLEIRAFSDAWFALLDLRPELRSLLSRASELVFRLDDRVIRVSAEDGVEELPEEFERWLRQGR